MATKYVTQASRSYGIVLLNAADIPLCRQSKDQTREHMSDGVLIKRVTLFHKAVASPILVLVYEFRRCRNRGSRIGYDSPTVFTSSLLWNVRKLEKCINVFDKYIQT